MVSVRASRLIWLGGVSVLLIASVCCSTFGSGEPPATEDAGDDGAVPPPADGAASDAADLDAPTTLRAACPPPSGGTSGPQDWTQRLLFTPPGPARMYPFDIATDSTHVTWLAQMGVTDGGSDVEPYNAHGAAVVLRVPKGGGAATTLARDQPKATAIALDGDAVYWATFNAVTNNAALLRQQRDVDCTSSVCPAPTPMASFPVGPLIVRLRRASPGVLFALADNGAVFRLNLGASAATVAQVTTTAQYPSLTVTDTDLYASAGKFNRVTRVPLLGASPPTTEVAFADAGTADPGASPIASDCSALWWVRKMPVPSLFSRPLGDAGPTFAALPLTNLYPYDLAADTRFVYIGAANAGGVYAVDKATPGPAVQRYAGNVFALAVDDDGVYFGEHGQVATAGKMWMLVKK